MNLKPIALICLISISIISCNKKPKKTEVPTPKPGTDLAEEILTELKEPKVGFECELEVLDTGITTQIFYLDRSKDAPKKPLYHKIFTVNADGKSVKPNITVGSRNIFFSIPYTSEKNGIFTATPWTSKVKNTTETNDQPNVYSDIANVSFDSKVNEFEISLISNSLNKKDNRTSAKIANCVEAEMVVPLGLD